MKTAADYIEAAQTAFEAGFLSNAARKRALEQLSYGYESVKRIVSDAILNARTAENNVEATADYYDMPFNLHQVREKHFDIAAKYTEAFAIVREMIAMRAAIQAAEIAPAPVKPEIEVKAQAVRESILDLMKRRQAQYVQALDIAHMIQEQFPDRVGAKALRVSCNAHWVHGHKGAVFLRYFFYLNGRMTALQVIIAAAQALDSEAA